MTATDGVSPMKIVLASYGSRGDVEPCAAVGRELLQRGHDVRMAVAPDRLAFAGAAGLTAEPYGRPTQEQMDMALDFLRRAANPITVLPQLAERVTGAWTEKGKTLAALTDGADLLVAGMNEQRLAANVAESCGIPLAALHFFPAQLLELGWLQEQLHHEAAAAQRRSLGLPELTDSAAESRPLEIQGYDELCVPGLAAEWSEYRRPFVGALTLGLPTDEDDEVMLWIGDGPPPIYFGFGSTPVTAGAQTVAMITAACAQLGERAVICSGPNDFTQLRQPEHVKIVRAVNHAAVFPACRAVVHHGGAGTTAAALRAGVPILILWVWLDQPMWASAVTALGVGLGRAFSATTQESLVADLAPILTPECAARARAVAAQVSKPADSVAGAADLLEAAARAGRSD